MTPLNHVPRHRHSTYFIFQLYINDSTTFWPLSQKTIWQPLWSLAICAKTYKTQCNCKCFLPSSDWNWIPLFVCIWINVCICICIWICISTCICIVFVLASVWGGKVGVRRASPASSGGTFRKAEPANSFLSCKPRPSNNYPTPVWQHFLSYTPPLVHISSHQVCWSFVKGSGLVTDLLR